MKLAFRRPHLVLLVAPLLVCFAAADAWAHCDGLDGPVVKAARRALETGDVNFTLIWVQEADEPVIRAAFEKTLVVRRSGPQARELADLYFFETLVRLHRTGEGAPYTGLKPAGRDLGPAIRAADTAVENGNVEPLVALLTKTVQTRVGESLEHVVAARKRAAPADVPAGREYVRAYVTFVHTIERLYEAATTRAHGHFPETESTAAPH